ncbi:MAG: VOC family protein [Gammaproteobacteria bacterium]|nr:VOC family protein [Gammaproteobacteria bacterium]
MHRSRIAGLIIDCKTDDLDSAARFWGRALGYEPKYSSNPKDQGYILLQTPSDEPHIELQKVTHASRVHIDIETDDVEAEVSRLEALGAKRCQKVRDWWVMEAPTGHRFCVIGTDSLLSESKTNKWE